MTNFADIKKENSGLAAILSQSEKLAKQYNQTD